MVKRTSIKVGKNIWGNYSGYIGGKLAFGPVAEEFRAKQWLDEKVSTGEYKLSLGSALWSGPKVGEK